METMMESADDKAERIYRGRILPCPFCGQPPQILASGEQWRGLMIHCISDNCANPSLSYYDHDTALRVWNRRAGGASR